MKPSLFFSFWNVPPEPISVGFAEGRHSFKSLGAKFYVDVPVRRVKEARLVLFNRALAERLNIALPKTDEEIEAFVLDRFAWFKLEEDPAAAYRDSADTRTFFATRYQDADDKSPGSALGDGRALWLGEIFADDVKRRMDVVAKGMGVTPLAWSSHPRKSHRDGLLGMTEAVHEYIHSLAAAANGIDTPAPLAVIEYPFRREATGEPAALIVRVGNHLRFAHYRYFSNQPGPLAQIFEYGLKRDLGLSPDYPVTARDVRVYWDRVVARLAREGAVYYDLHAVHGAPTFGNRTSDGGTIDLSTFVYLDAHHAAYRYMAGGNYSLGGAWGQHEQLFALFGDLTRLLRSSRFKYAQDIDTEKSFWGKFSAALERNLTHRWLKRLGLDENEMAALSLVAQKRFYRSVRALYETQGKEKIRLDKGKFHMAAFEPRHILAQSACRFDKFDEVDGIWDNLFKVRRNWATASLAQARPLIAEYVAAVKQLVDELDATGRIVGAWQDRNRYKRLAERREPGGDFFYDSERFLASREVLALIRQGQADWKQIGNAAAAAAESLIDDNAAQPPLVIR